MMIFMPFFVIAGLLAGGLAFAIQSLICARVQNPKLRMLPMCIIGGVLLICALLWLFGISTTVFITGPGKLAVYDHIILAIMLAPSFIAMEAAWMLQKREKVEVRQPLYGKGVWYAFLSVGIALVGTAFSELFMVQLLSSRLWMAVILGTILLVNTLYRWLKFRQAPRFQGILADISIAVGILLLEALAVTLLPKTVYLSYNLDTALGTSATVYLTLAVVIQFVLNQDDRPGVYAMLRLLVKALAYITGGAMVLWIVAYQINCDDSKSLLMAIAFFGPLLVGLLMGYLLLLRRNGSLKFEDFKAQSTVHGLLPVALLLLCFLTGAIRFSDMEYRHEVRSRMAEWRNTEQSTGISTEREIYLELEARDHASDMFDMKKEAIDGRVEVTLSCRWTPFDWPWAVRVGTWIPLDGTVTTVCLNEESVSVHGVVLRYNTVTGQWESDDSDDSNTLVVRLTYMGNKKRSITIEDKYECLRLLAFMADADGTQEESSKGHYGVPYTLEVYFGDGEAPLIFYLWSKTQYSTSRHTDSSGYPILYNDDLTDFYQYLERNYPDDFWYGNPAAS